MLADCFLTGDPFNEDLAPYSKNFSLLSKPLEEILQFKEVEHFGPACANYSEAIGRKYDFPGIRCLKADGVVVDKDGTLYTDSEAEQKFGSVDQFNGVGCYCSQVGDSVFGHWLIHTLPRVWYYSTQIGQQNFKVVLHKRAAKLYKLFEPVFKLIPNLEGPLFLDDVPTRIEQLYFCEKPSRGNTLVETNFIEFRNWLLEQPELKDMPVDSEKEYPEKIYFSRSNWKRLPRILVNYEDVENVFRSNGFKIVHPEDIPLMEMFDLISKCKVMAGERGSAMHLSAFSPTVESVIVLTFNEDKSPMWPAQAGVCAVCDQKTVFVFGAGEITGESRNHFDYTVSTDDLKAAIERT